MHAPLVVARVGSFRDAPYRFEMKSYETRAVVIHVSEWLDVFVRSRTES